jgi:aminotransferase
MFLQAHVQVLVEETEYTPYFDALNLLKRKYRMIPSNPSNSFRPSVDDYKAEAAAAEREEEGTSVFVLKSNPCNPTGVTWTGQQLQSLVETFLQDGRGALIDEAYEFFHHHPDSALRYVPDIDKSNIFVVSAATKGLQAPGLRVGWVIASKKNIELLRNYSSIGMGGVARPSQICTAGLLEMERVTLARKAIAQFYSFQRQRYGEELKRLGFELFTGEGGFYHWARLPHALTAEEFNRRLFAHEAAILPGTLCDMFRRGDASPHASFVRFSFGPLPPDSFQRDIEILESCLKQ